MTSTKKKVFLLTSILAIIGVLISAAPVMAYEIATPVNPTGRTWEWGGGSSFVWTTQQGSTEYSNTISYGDAIFLDVSAGNNSMQNYWILKAVAATNRIDFKKGYYYKTQLSFNFGGGDRFGIQMPQLNRFVEYNGAPFRLMNISPSYSTCYEVSYENGRYITGTGNSAWTADMSTGCLRGYITYDIILQATRDETAVFQLGDGQSWFIQMQVLKDTSLNPHSLRVGTLRPLTIMEFEGVKLDSINQQQTEAGQQAQQDGNTGSNTSQESVTQGSQTMLQGAQTILGVITDTPAGTCNISGNMGNIDLGQLNFCEGNFEQLKPVIRIIVNLVMGVATWHIFTFLLGTMTALFLSFTGGRKVDGE